MEMRRHVCRALHDDHVATMVLLSRLEKLLGRNGPDRMPDAADAAAKKLFDDLVAAVQTEIGPHFAFEDEHAFPLLAEAGFQEMTKLLISEHGAILPLARRMAEIAKGAREAGFAGEAWRQFHGTGAELIQRLAAHVEKEEMGLLPALDDALDDAADERLALALAAGR